MTEKMGGFADLTILKRDNKYFVQYDAGAHAVVWREDEISHEEALVALKGPQSANAILLELQKRLADSGVDPYRSNFKKPELER